MIKLNSTLSTTEKQRLKTIAMIAKSMDEQSRYTSFIRKYLPTFGEFIEKAEFIGEGHGVNNLNVYRKVKTQQGYLFEKIYFSNSEDLEAVVYFDKHLQGIVDTHQIRTPKIQKIISGKVLTSVYFDFIHLKSIRDKKITKEIVLLSNTLRSISIENTLIDIPTHLFDFRNHFLYQQNSNFIQAIFLKHYSSLTTFEEEICSYRKVLCHSDLYSPNVYKNATIIDWDYFGILPIGFEQARIYFLFRMNEFGLSSPKIWLKTHYLSSISGREWSQFERSFFFFLLVFLSKKIYKEDFKSLKEEVLSFLF